jgi:hypothetical protein
MCTRTSLAALALLTSSAVSVPPVTLPVSLRALTFGSLSPSSPRTYLSASGSPSLPTFDFLNSEYTVNVSVGSPPSPFRMVLDTAAGNSWLSTPGCSDFVQSPACMYTAKYSSAGDSAYRPCTGLCLFLMPLTDGNQTLVGELGNSTFSLGGLAAPSAAFGMVSELPLPRLSGQAFDGVVGLAFQNGSTVPLLAPPAPLLDVLVGEGVMAPLFSLFLNRGDTPGAAGKSAWMLGGADAATYSTGQLVTLPPAPFWQPVLGLWAVTMDYVFGK